MFACLLVSSIDGLDHTGGHSKSLGCEEPANAQRNMSCHGKHGSLPTFQMFHGGVQGTWLGCFFKGRIFQHEDWHKWYRMPMLVSGTTLFVRFSAKKNVYATCDFGPIEGKLDCRSSGFLLARFIHIVLVGDFMALQTGSPLRRVVSQIGSCLFPGDSPNWLHWFKSGFDHQSAQSCQDCT